MVYFNFCSMLLPKSCMFDAPLGNSSIFLALFLKSKHPASASGKGTDVWNGDVVEEYKNM